MEKQILGKRIFLILVVEDNLNLVKLSEPVKSIMKSI